MNSYDSSNVNLDIFTVGEMVDKAIVHLSSIGNIGKINLQKGVFLYLISLAKARGYDAEKVLKIAGFEPYKFGPFSDFLNGEIDQLKGYKEISIRGNGDSIKVTTNKSSINRYKLDHQEKLIMENVKHLVQDLEPMEMMFYIYFNPAIDSRLREYFTKDSEIKEKLLKDRDKYIKKLMDKNILDEDAANMILYA